ncbi:MAG: hypothetical protein ACI4XE_03880, partial [Acutalibacteraceae bacterium]
MKNRMTKKILSLIAVVLAVCALGTSVYAAVVVYSDVETTWLDFLDPQTVNNIPYDAVGGIATGKTRNSMFVLLSERNNGGHPATEQRALFYDYPNINNLSNRHYYTLPYAGHANGMTIDDNNIYVCGWTMYGEGTGNQANNTHNNWIIMIPRTMFTALRQGNNGATMPKDDRTTEAVEGYSILYPKVKHIASDGTVTYTDYTGVITCITLHGSNGHFIINYSGVASGNDFCFTTAKIETVNGKKYFVVSDNINDIFFVQNNAAYQNSMSQDICYAPGHGFFIPRWYSTYNSTKNIIFWADIDGASSTKTVNNVNYRYYIPDKINVDKTNSTFTNSDGEKKKKFKVFE